MNLNYTPTVKWFLFLFVALILVYFSTKVYAVQVEDPVVDPVVSVAPSPVENVPVEKINDDILFKKDVFQGKKVRGYLVKTQFGNSLMKKYLVTNNGNCIYDVDTVVTFCGAFSIKPLVSKK